ncbi:MAG: phosphate ABC transporter permease PstA [Acidimicrobiia bacterium]|nr:phosphate ABC transporter permease PstA [Acidimicrobiia bacterium]
MVQLREQSEAAEFFPSDVEYQGLLSKRSRRGRVVQLSFLLMLTIAVVGLGILLYTIIDDSFGLVAVVNQNEPEAVVSAYGYDPAVTVLDDLNKEQLVDVLQGSVSSGVGRRLEREERFFADRLVFESQAKWDEVCASDEPPSGCSGGVRSKGNVLDLVRERVIQPDIVAVNRLTASIFNPDGFKEEVETAFVENPSRFGEYTYDQVRYQWRAWFSWKFVTSPASDRPEIAGVRTAVLGSIWLVIITVLFAVPVGVGAAIYLEEFARPTRINDLIQTNINNLAGVPSIIYGMLGLAVLVRILEPFTSGSLFGEGAPNGRTIMSAGLTLGLLTLPVVIISSQEAIRAVPSSLRQAGMGLGATKWQTVRSQVLPVAIPGILTGTILAVARAIGETAPLILVGAASFITVSPSGPFSQFTALPIQIFQWTSFPQEEWRHLAAAASLVLLVLLLTLNAAAVIMRNRFSRRMS